MIDYQLLDGTNLELTVPVMISLLGSFRLLLQGNLAAINSGSKSENLLICLALASSRRVPRAEILERIWPQSDPMLAGQSLNSLTYQLNKLAARIIDGAGLIIHENGFYRLNKGDEVETDVHYFDAWCKTGKNLLRREDVANGIAYFEQALMLYRGDLCGDSSIRTVIERERLRAAFLDLLAYLVDHYYTHKDLTKALYYIQRLLAHDPCREDAHRQAMRCYMHMGQRSQALRQFRICCRALAAEFDAKPEPATVNLFNQIRLDPAGFNILPH